LKSAQDVIKTRYPAAFWDALKIFDELGYSKVESIEKNKWSNKEEESTLSDLCRSLNTELIFSSFVRYCTK